MSASSPAASEPKKRLILEAVRRLLVERGFQDIVLDDVAREAGVAKGTLFLYYRNKDELFSAAFADLVDQIGRALEALLGSGRRGQALLAETVRTLLAHFDRNRDFLSQFGAGRFPGCGDRSCELLMDRLRKNLGLVIRILRLCVRDRVLGGRDLESAAAGLFGLCRSAIIHKIITGDRRPLTARTQKILDLYLYGVRGRR